MTEDALFKKFLEEFGLTSEFQDLLGDLSIDEYTSSVDDAEDFVIYAFILDDKWKRIDVEWRATLAAFWGHTIVPISIGTIQKIKNLLESEGFKSD